MDLSIMNYQTLENQVFSVKTIRPIGKGNRIWALGLQHIPSTEMNAVGM